MLKTILSSIMAGLFCLGLAAPLSAQAQTLEAIKQAGVLRVGMADSTPAQQKNPATGEWEGFNVDMANNLATALGVKLQIVDQTWSTIIPSLMQNQYDIAMVDMFRTPGRALTVDFTDSYMSTGNTWLVRGDLNVDDWTKLNDPKYNIVAIAGMASVAQSARLLPNAQQKTIVSDNAVAAELEVASGRADATLSDTLTHLLFMKANPTAYVKIVGRDKPIEETGFAYAIRPGDYHFLAFLNTWIAYIQSTGYLSERKKFWYGGE